MFAVGRGGAGVVFALGPILEYPKYGERGRREAYGGKEAVCAW